MRGHEAPRDAERRPRDLANLVVVLALLVGVLTYVAGLAGLFAGGFGAVALLVGVRRQSPWRRIGANAVAAAVAGVLVAFVMWWYLTAM